MNNQYTPDYSSSSSRYTTNSNQLGLGSQAPFTQDLSQASYAGGRKGKGVASAANNGNNSRPLTQNTYSSQASIGISQSDRIHTQAHHGLGHGMSSMMSQESMGYLDDYKSQQDDYLSQDSFAPNAFQSQGFTQY
jgi:hypothetical protein